eukprot:COSAG02_NODE_1132_length_14392_cov_7.068910_14_plen_164_part_00
MARLYTQDAGTMCCQTPSANQAFQAFLRALTTKLAEDPENAGQQVAKNVLRKRQSVRKLVDDPENAGQKVAPGALRKRTARQQKWKADNSSLSSASRECWHYACLWSCRRTPDSSCSTCIVRWRLFSLQNCSISLAVLLAAAALVRKPKRRSKARRFPQRDTW